MIVRLGSDCKFRQEGKGHVLDDGRLGTVCARDNGHLLDAAAHWSSRNVLDITASVQVIEHADIEEVVALEDVVGVNGVVRPSKSMAVGVAFRVTGKEGDSVVD